MSVLNDDCLLAIFKRLDANDRLREEIVCKQWQRLLKNGWKFTTRLDIASFDHGTEPRRLECILRRAGAFLVELDFSQDDTTFDHKDAVEVFQSHRHSHLKPVIKLSDVEIGIVARFCPSLRRLTIRKAELSPTAFTPLSQLANLRILELLNCLYLDGTLECVCGSCTKEDWPAWSKYSANAFQCVYDRELSRSLSMLTSLNQLHIVGFTANTSVNFLTALQSNVKRVQFRNDDHSLGELTTQTLGPFFDGHRELEEVRIENCILMKPDTLSGIHVLTQLKRFSIDRSMSRLNEIYGLANLVELKISSTSAGGDSELLRDKGIKMIADQSPNLRILHIRGRCAGVSAKGYMRVAGLRELEELEMGMEQMFDTRETGMNAEVFSAMLAKLGRNLRSLCVAFPTAIDDACLQRAAVTAPSLECLCVTHCNAITPSGIANFLASLASSRHDDFNAGRTCRIFTSVSASDIESAAGFQLPDGIRVFANCTDRESHFSLSDVQ